MGQVASPRLGRASMRAPTGARDGSSAKSDLPAPSRQARSLLALTANFLAERVEPRVFPTPAAGHPPVPASPRLPVFCLRPRRMCAGTVRTAAAIHSCTHSCRRGVIGGGWLDGHWLAAFHMTCTLVPVSHLPQACRDRIGSCSLQPLPPLPLRPHLARAPAAESSGHNTAPYCPPRMPRTSHTSGHWHCPRSWCAGSPCITLADVWRAMQNNTAWRSGAGCDIRARL